jgi:hypothetical protein
VRAELALGAGSARWSEYLSAGNQLIGVRFLEVDTGTLTTRYFHTDHLGSVSVITNEAGAAVERLSYDAWGKRRNATTWEDDPAGAIASQTTAGFTGQEELSVGLVHLNGPFNVTY